MIKRAIKYLRENKKALNEINNRLISIEYANHELLFASYFQDSIQDSVWVKNKSFSAYGGAANYSLLYKLFKIYDVLQPKTVLEFGLGQTTKLSSQYATFNKKAKVFVVDDDAEWVEVYKKQTKIPTNLELLNVELQDFKHKGHTLQRLGEYSGLNEYTAGVKFNLVIVDGPIGYDKEYPRTNVVSMVDDLDTEWIVIFDDAERAGEQRTMELFREALRDKDLEFAEFAISGTKTQRYFCDKRTEKLLYAL